jgi:hypothetical protein
MNISKTKNNFFLEGCIYERYSNTKRLGYLREQCPDAEFVKSVIVQEIVIDSLFV